MGRMRSSPDPAGAARPTAADVQAQIAAYIRLPVELRDRLDPTRLALADLQRAYVRAQQAECVKAA